MKRLFIIVASVLFFVSCSKNENDKEPGVWIRLENKTSVVLESARIGDVMYGDIGTSNLTEYKLVSSPIYNGTCMFKINGEDNVAGSGFICLTPPPPTFKDGYYTFRVEPAQGYFTVVVRK